jgi:transposase
MLIQDLDHLGIIAGIIDQLGLEQRVNECLGTHPQQKVSPGQGVKAMILNGLGFVSASLYLYGAFFAGKATGHLLAETVEPEHLNDDYLGRLLDKIWDYGPSELFSVIAMDAYRRFGLDTSRYHFDTSSVSVEGAYEDDPGEGEINITHGYSKDHRPDLKQFIVEMMCCNDGDVPLTFASASGNQSDKAIVAERVKAFAQQWQIDGVFVCDSALYSQDNLTEMGELRWITRVPFSLSEAQDLVCDLPPEAFHPCEREGYRWASACSTYGAVKQLWVVLENQARIESDLQRLERQVHKQRQQAEKQLRAQAKLAFRCEQDALVQTQKLGQRWLYHRLGEIEVLEMAHYDHPGRPKTGELPTHFTYHIRSTVIEDETAIARAKRKAGRFILATNELEHQTLLAQNPVMNAFDAQRLIAEQVLSDYKGQQAPERGFGILKDPLFFASSVFLNTPSRIEALAIIMGLSLIVYTLGQRQLRQALAQADETVLDQRKRPTQTPTLRWICQCFQSVHWVAMEAKVQVSNLTPERLKILRFFGSPCQKYYLLC